MKLHERMTRQENDSLMGALRKAAYTGGTVNVSDHVKTKAHIVSYRRRSGRRTRALRLALAAILILALLSASVASANSGPPAVEGCVEDFDHHNPTANPYFDRLFTGGTVWVHKALNSVIIFVKIKECGDRYLIGFWRNGVFTTSFLANWGYVQSNIAGFAKTVLSRVRVTSIWFVVAPCPGSWTNFTRPCGSGSNE